MLWIVSFFTLLAVAADYLYFRHMRRRAPAERHRLFVVFCIVTDLIPATIALLNVLLSDNDTPFMTFVFWAFWVWVVTVIPRMVYYLFRLIRLPRIGFAVAICLAAYFIWGAVYGRTTILVNRIEVSSPRIPAGFDGFRIVQISDIHLGDVVCLEKELPRIVDSVNTLRPDLIVFCGDLVNIRSSELDAQTMELLDGFRAPYGVISVTGNHDVGVYIKDTIRHPAEASLAEVVARQRELGWRVLEDTTVYLHRNGDSISFTGISFDPALRKLRHDSHLPQADFTKAYAGVPDSIFNITAVHLPQLWDQITDRGFGDLTLSGHVHSMQMKIKLFGRAYSPAQWMYTRWSGRYDEAGRTLYINDGTGCVGYPMRLGAYPEVTLITLRQ